jgi:hypothetical protein
MKDLLIIYKKVVDFVFLIIYNIKSFQHRKSLTKKLDKCRNHAINLIRTG